MGVLQSLGRFFFGSEADIFDAKGRVVHQHPKKKWDAWQNRMKNDPQMNWRQHSGVNPKAASHPNGKP